MTEEELVASLRRAFALRGTSVSDDEVLGVALDLLRQTGRSCLRYMGGKTPSYETDDLMVDAALILFDKEPQFESTEHFLNWAWQVAKRLHGAHWQRKARKKRGFDYRHVPIGDVSPAKPSSVLDVDLISLDAALEEFRTHHPDQYRVITLRFLLGYSVVETASLLGMSERTVRRRAREARRWLGGQQ